MNDFFQHIVATVGMFLLMVPAKGDGGPSKWEHYVLTHCEVANNESDIYVQGMIELAFSYSSATYEIRGHGMGCTQQREVQRMEFGLTDFIWAGTTKELEARLIPIRIPLYKGMLGYRVLLVRQNDAPKFKRLNTLKALKKLKYGQGEGWSDTDILRQSGFNVVTSSEVRNLFKMLSAKRFDAFPRGLMEPWDEVEKYASFNFKVEEHLAIHYPQPAYIFVSPKRPELASLLENGLLAAVKDGRFDQYFYSNKRVKNALEKAKLQQRNVFFIDNPFLPKNTPLARKELWLDFTSSQASN